MKKAAISVLLGVALLLQCLPEATADGDAFSYRRIYELLHQFQALPAEDTTHIAFRARVVNPAGPPPDSLRIAHREPIDIAVDDYGLFEIPMSPQLAQLNPRLVPTPAMRLMRLGLAIVIRLPESGTPDGQWLLEGLRQANAAIRARSRIHPRLVPQAQGVTLRFAPDADASVGVIVDGEVFSFTPDAEGRIDLPLDPERHADAVIRMSHRPEYIFPLFD